MSLIILSVNGAAAKRNTCTLAETCRSSTLHWTFRHDFSGAFQTRGDVRSSLSSENPHSISLFTAPEFGCCVCVCVPLGNLRIPAQPRRSAGPQGRAVCKCVRGAHMSACTCTCLCLYSNISTLQWGWFYPTCHHTRQEIKPEGVCLPWKSLNRLLQWNPGVHPARTCSTPMNNILWKW